MVADEQGGRREQGHGPGQEGRVADRTILASAAGGDVVPAEQGQEGRRRERPEQQGRRRIRPTPARSRTGTMTRIIASGPNSSGHGRGPAGDGRRLSRRAESHSPGCQRTDSHQSASPEAKPMASRARDPGSRAGGPGCPGRWPRWCLSCGGPPSGRRSLPHVQARVLRISGRLPDRRARGPV